MRPDLNLCTVLPIQFMTNHYIKLGANKKLADIHIKSHDMMAKGPHIREAAVIACEVMQDFIELRDTENARKWADILKRDFLIGYGTMKIAKIIAPNINVNALRLFGIYVD